MYKIRLFFQKAHAMRANEKYALHFNLYFTDLHSTKLLDRLAKIVAFSKHYPKEFGTPVLIGKNLHNVLSIRRTNDTTLSQF